MTRQTPPRTPARPGSGAGRSAPRGTSTSNFGVSRRESHDSSDFYARFNAPLVDLDTRPAGPEAARSIDEIFCGDARDMADVASNSVGLVVTSPPYFAGKEYEEALGEGHIPASYLDYLEMLTDVFAECVRVLEPGGRIAVNVANLGRRPYRSLSGDVTAILQDRLGLLLRGEIIWQKQRGAGGNCAWGSFQRPGNPVLRDVSERVVVASKGRFDRALTASQRESVGLPHLPTITRDEFMDATLDVWEFPAESATRIGHPAPFPVSLPARLIQLHTYRGDLVLDPFMGSGSTAIAATLAGRHYVGYDTDPRYVDLASERVREARAAHTPRPPSPHGELETLLVAGHSARDVAQALLEAAGATSVIADPRGGGGEFAFAARDLSGATVYVDVAGSFSSSRGGLNRGEVLWRSMGRAALLAALEPDARLLVLSPEVPRPGSSPSKPLDALRTAGTIAAVVDLTAPDAVEQIQGVLAGPPGA